MADGFDAPKAGKIDEPRKFKRALAWKKLRGFFALCCLLPVLWICLNLEVNLLAVSAVKVWKFCSSELFQFVLINVIVIVLVVMSGSLRPSNGQEDLYDEFVRRNQAARKEYAVVDAASEAGKVIEVPGHSATRSLQTAKSFGGSTRPRGRKIRRSESAELIKQRREGCEEAVVSNSLIVMEVPDAMPAEELQRRSDELIAKVNRQIRQGG